LTDVYDADEAFVTGTFGSLTPVFNIDGRDIGNAKSGKLTHQLSDLYLNLISQYVEQQKLKDA
jgi:branched-chain amino acid aminotransferase